MVGSTDDRWISGHKMTSNHFAWPTQMCGSVLGKLCCLPKSWCWRPSSSISSINEGSHPVLDTSLPVLPKNWLLFWNLSSIVGTRCTLVHCSLYTGCIYRGLPLISWEIKSSTSNITLQHQWHPFWCCSPCYQTNFYLCLSFCGSRGQIVALISAFQDQNVHMVLWCARSCHGRNSMISEWGQKGLAKKLRLLQRSGQRVSSPE